MKKRGAIQWSALLGVVATILAGVVLLFFLQSGAEAMGRGDARQQCLNSVRAQALLQTIHPGTNVDLRCTTWHQRVDIVDPEGQKQVLAEEMAHCWSQYGEGKIRLFDVSQGQNSYCVVCSRLEFSSPQKLTGFTSYLFEHSPKFKQGSFHAYLYNTKKSQALVKAYGSAGLKDKDVIDTSQDWAVLHVVLNKVDKTNGHIATVATVGAGAVVTVATFGAGLPVIVAGGLAGGTGGYFIAPYFWNQDYGATTALIPYDSIPDYKCNRLEGIAGPIDFVT